MKNYFLNEHGEYFYNIAEYFIFNMECLKLIIYLFILWTCVEAAPVLQSSHKKWGLVVSMKVCQLQRTNPFLMF
jgi:hypothetical protein